MTSYAVTDFPPSQHTGLPHSWCAEDTSTPLVCHFHRETEMLSEPAAVWTSEPMICWETRAPPIRVPRHLNSPSPTQSQWGTWNFTLVKFLDHMLAQWPPATALPISQSCFLPTDCHAGTYKNLCSQYRGQNDSFTLPIACCVHQYCCGCLCWQDCILSAPVSGCTLILFLLKWCPTSLSHLLGTVVRGSGEEDLPLFSTVVIRHPVLLWAPDHNKRQWRPLSPLSG